MCCSKLQHFFYSTIYSLNYSVSGIIQLDFRTLNQFHWVSFYMRFLLYYIVAERFMVIMYCLRLRILYIYRDKKQVRVSYYIR